MQRRVIGSAVGIVSSVGLAAAMLPIRSHLSVATPALVLVVPVVAGVITGGLPAGVASVAAGFLVYDFAFIPPYDALTVGAAENWVALAVYAVVMVLVAQVVAHMETARSEAHARAVETRRLFELSELLVGDRSFEELLQTIVDAVQTTFGVTGVALLLPPAGHLTVAACAGIPMSEQELSELEPQSGVPVSVGTVPGPPDRIRAVALSASGRPVGMLAIRGFPYSVTDRELLRGFANHAALTLERAQLREQAMRSDVLEEADRVRRALLGAVSHDLRTPLATIKVASSTLLEPTSSLTQADVRELYGLIDVQTDRLTRLVANLLDMTRLDAGVLELRLEVCSVLDLAGEAVAGMRAAFGDREVELAVAEQLPLVEVDRLLIVQVLANLLDNAQRLAPASTPITVSAQALRDRVTIAVTDRGPGVAASERDAVFERFTRFDSGGRAGLGLAIAKTFVEAHGERIWVEDDRGGGARFAFTVPVASRPESGGDRPWPRSS